MYVCMGVNKVVVLVLLVLVLSIRYLTFFTVRAHIIIITSQLSLDQGLLREDAVGLTGV